jgi:hypothetical protein
MNFTSMDDDPRSFPFPLIFRAAFMDPVGFCFATWETAMD